MDISGISNVLKVLRPQADLEKAAEAMASEPDKAVSRVAAMLQQISNGQPDGVGCAGSNAVEAFANLRTFVSAASGGEHARPSSEDFAKVLIHVTQVEADLRYQLNIAQTEETRQALQQAMAATESLKHFSR